MRHIWPRQDSCQSLLAKYLHIHIPALNQKKIFPHTPCSSEIPLSPCLLNTGWDRMQEIQRSQKKKEKNEGKKQVGRFGENCPKLRITEEEKIVVNSVKNWNHLASFVSKPHGFGSLSNC